MRTCLPPVSNAENFGLAYDVLGPAPGPGSDDRKNAWLDACAGLATPRDYGIHFKRWRRSFGPNTRLCEVKTASRLLIGHGNPSASDVGLTVHRTWGTPVIPGTALKGLLSGYVDAVYGPDASCSDSVRNDWAAPTWKGFNVVGAPGRWHALVFGAPAVPHRIEITVRFGEALTVDVSGGTPTIEITICGELRRAEYVRGSGTMTLTFIYRVTAEDRVVDDVNVWPDSLKRNGGKIRNATGTGQDPGDGGTVKKTQAIVKYLGGHRGGVTFHDALCVPPDGDGAGDHFCYALDMLTLHQKPYYDTHGAELPNDWNSPVPVPFLTVKPGVRFLLALDGPPRVTGLAMKMLLDALSEWGVGAKTSLGYGTVTHDREKEERARREAEERERREREAAEREERLAALSPIERKIEEILDSRTDKGMSESVAIMKKVEADHWSKEGKIEVVQWLWKKMKDEGRWKEKSGKKNPAKDMDHQRTLLVMRWLNERPNGITEKESG